MNPDEVRSRLSSVEDPDLGDDIVSLGLVNAIDVDAETIRLSLALGAPYAPNESQIADRVRAALADTDREIELTAAMPPGLHTDEEVLPNIQNIIAVASGKGGVGKSTVSVNLAAGLAKRGARVGLFDTDIYGPNVPRMVDSEDAPEATDDKTLIPPEQYGLKLMSMDFLVGPDDPVIWRGPMVHKMLTQLVEGEGGVSTGEFGQLLVVDVRCVRRWWLRRGETGCRCLLTTRTACEGDHGECAGSGEHVSSVHVCTFFTEDMGFLNVHIGISSSSSGQESTDSRIRPSCLIQRSPTETLDSRFRPRHSTELTETLESTVPDRDAFSVDRQSASMGADELAWKTNERDVVYSCPGFDIINERVTLPNGVETDYDHLHDVPAVVVIPLTPDGEVVVIEEWRQSVKRVHRGFPAGSLEPGDDDLATAARRELEEETGYVAESITYLDEFEPANGVMDARFTYVLAEGCRPEGEQDLDHNESIRVDITTMERLEARLREGTLDDGRTALGLLLYQFSRNDT